MLFDRSVMQEQTASQASYDGTTLNINKAIKATSSTAEHKFGTVITGLSGNTVYQAATDGFVYVYTNNGTNLKYWTFYNDASNPPTTEREQKYTGTSWQLSSLFPVKAGTYYKVTLVSTPNLSAYEFWGK